MGNMIKVGMADLKLCKAPDAVTTLGLGSCVGIAIRDPITKIGGLAHIMLPDSTQFSGAVNIPKYADTGAKELVRIIVEAGGNRSRLVAKIAGGAQMFQFQSKSEMTAVGQRNVEAVKKVLAELKIRILAEDTGLNFGRTVEFYPETGDYIIKAVGKGVKTI
ncbi:MAG: chemotaxis protein CheD [Lachnospiraceae bacterium]|nr:chemotaxis protein CheD [Lachnospiraceae bacterium]